MLWACMREVPTSKLTWVTTVLAEVFPLFSPEAGMEPSKQTVTLSFQMLTYSLCMTSTVEIVSLHNVTMSVN
jgi:hypothetical protein